LAPIVVADEAKPGKELIAAATVRTLRRGWVLIVLATKGAVADTI
jgi:hypothetical protein